jgi:hypothetical protein
LHHVNKYTDGKWILGEFENSTVSVVALCGLLLFFENVK